MTIEKAKHYAGRLAGSFSSRTMSPQVYAAEVASRFMEFPEPVVKETLNRLQEGEDYVPSIKRVLTVLREEKRLHEWRRNRVPVERRIEPEPKIEQTPEDRKIMAAMLAHLRYAVARKDRKRLDAINALQPHQFESFLNTWGWEPVTELTDEHGTPDSQD